MRKYFHLQHDSDSDSFHFSRCQNADTPLDPGGDQGDPRAPAGQSAPGARNALAIGARAACAVAELKRFTHRCKFNRMYP